MCKAKHIPICIHTKNIEKLLIPLNTKFCYCCMLYYYVYIYTRGVVGGNNFLSFPPTFYFFFFLLASSSSISIYHIAILYIASLFAHSTRNIFYQTTFSIISSSFRRWFSTFFFNNHPSHPSIRPTPSTPTYKYIHFSFCVSKF